MEFDESFFEKEVRCGFTISAMMKRAWAAELEVLSVVDEVCRKNQITWFADWGTLLGAVRHQGFIPWDDDIDICIKREDFNKLIEVLPRDLPYGFVISGTYADSERLRDAGHRWQLRVIADELLWDFNDYMRYFHGFPYQRIGIDIFPMDYLPRDLEVRRLRKEFLLYGYLTVQNWKVYQGDGTLEERLEALEKIFQTHIDRDSRYHLCRLMGVVAGSCREEDADEMTELYSSLDKEQDRLVMKKEWFSDVVYLPFENGFQVPAPCEYEKVLETQYGDYMVMKKNTASHNYPFYKSMEAELRKQVRAIRFPGSVDEFCRQMANGTYQVKSKKL